MLMMKMPKQKRITIMEYQKGQRYARLLAKQK